jgi:predicted PurR-regulated permease PerM
MSVNRPGTQQPSHVAAADVARGARYAFGAVLVVVGALAIWQLRAVLLSILLGLLLAAGFDPLVTRLQRRGVNRTVAALGFLALLLLLVAGFFVLALAPAASQLATLISTLPEYVDRLAQSNQRIADAVNRFDITTNLEGIISRLPSLLGAGLGILSGIVGAIFTGFTTLALTAYFLLALPRLRATAAAVLRHPERVAVFSTALEKVGGYITGQALISTGAGIAAFIALAVIGAPYVALLALTVAFLSLIPQVGATLGAAIAVVVTLTNSVPKALVALVFFVTYQQIENYVIAPRVFAHTVSLTPLTAFVSVLVGAGLAGLVGAIFALPVAAMLKTVFAYVFRDRIAAIRGEPPGGHAEPEPLASRGPEPLAPGEPAPGTDHPKRVP